MARRRLRALARRIRAALDSEGMRSELATLRTRLDLDGPHGGMAAGPTMLERIVALERWLDHHPPPPTLVTVVVPTLDRPDLLAGAIASVQAQTHHQWELIVADDGASEGTRELLAGLDDERIRSIRTERAGAPGARNRALDLARGELIAYLDDDNLMLPGWLTAVAWAFDRHPEIDVLYGGRIVEDESMFGIPARLPRLLMADYDRAALERANFTDTNVIAHRAGTPGARWDESLAGAADWDLMLRLTGRGPPLALPAIATLYRTSAPNRSVEGERFAESHAAVVKRFAERRSRDD